MKPGIIFNNRSLALPALLGTSILLGGCGVPVPLQIASWAADGFSYVATEKTIADHGISALAQKDCAMLRPLKGQELCTEVEAADAPPEEDIALADESVEDANVEEKPEELAATEEPAEPAQPDITGTTLNPSVMKGLFVPMGW